MVRVAIEGLKKGFGQTQVLKGVDIDLPDGGFAVLVGPSGCGKSTLLRLIAGLELSDEGSIRFGERDVTRLPPRERDVAMVFQSYALYPHLTVRKNLSFGLELKGTPASEIESRVKEVSAMLGLEQLLDRMPKALSGGQRQRVAMGRAIVRRPALFLFDEPLSNLDAALRAQVRVDIRKQHDALGATSVYVTHDQVEAMTLADRLFVFNQGLVEQSGAPLEIYARPATRFVAAFLGSPAMNFIDVLAKQGADGWTVEAPGLSLRAPMQGLSGIADSQPLTLGVRPHALEQRADGGVKLRVEVIEALGSETFAHGKVGEATVVARLDSGAKVSAGQELTLGAAPEELHLFDPESGAALR
ncbi:MAG: sn-glycerol-3-phosphate ABC transporter ATP-binding protein UgpC [Myxococcales bacterium]|nr:sn-glycerol-3-phosphate ABC transporter ATP-binding protein UgpC [Myxococcales bacterium]